MICPDCKAEMKEGIVQIRGSMLTFLAVGFSIQDLMFDADEETTTIISSREKRKGFYCPECSGAFIQGSDLPGNKIIDPRTGVVTEFDNGKKGNH